jgi:hypothetical protein
MNKVASIMMLLIIYCQDCNAIHAILTNNLLRLAELLLTYVFLGGAPFELLQVNCFEAKVLQNFGQIQVIH